MKDKQSKIEQAISKAVKDERERVIEVVESYADDFGWGVNTEKVMKLLKETP